MANTKQHHSAATASNNKGHLSLTFEECYKDPLFKKAFHAYCSSIQVTESYNFIDLICNFVTVQADEARYVLADQIIQRFIDDDAKTEINLPAATKQSILEQFAETCSRSKCPKDLFQIAHDDVALQVKFEIWPNFTKSLQYHDAMRERRQTRRQTHVGQALSTVSAEQNTQVIQYDDFARLQELCHESQEDSLWQPHGCNNKYIKVMVASPQLLQNAKANANVKFFKISGSLPYPGELVLRALFETSTRSVVDGNLADVKSLELRHKNHMVPFATAITQERFKMVWPMSDREMIYATASIYDDNNRNIVVARKPTHHMMAFQGKDTIRAYSTGGYLIEKLTANVSKFHECYMIDFGSWIPHSFFSMLLEKRANMLHAKLIQVLSAMQEQVPPTNTVEEDATLSFGPSYGILETLKHNSKQT